MKMMFYLVDICSKELAECLGKATAEGKLQVRASRNKNDLKF
jgi:hypothetical protein